MAPTTNKPSGQTPNPAPRCPRRIVLLVEDELSEVEQVLAEYRGSQITGQQLHEDLRKFAAQYPGRRLAAEWLSGLGWTRFLWRRG